jgi:hypothetical protein
MTESSALKGINVRKFAENFRNEKEREKDSVASFFLLSFFLFLSSLFLPSLSLLHTHTLV